MFRLLFILFTIAVVFNGPCVHIAFLSIRNNVRSEIKNDIKKGIPEAKLHCIRDNKQLNWIEKNKEFRIGKHLYDVVKIKNIDGQRVYLCINDTDEDEIFASLDAAVDQQTKREKQSVVETLLNNFIGFLNEENPTGHPSLMMNYTQERIEIPYQFSISKINIDTPNPPPNSRA